MTPDCRNAGLSSRISRLDRTYHAHSFIFSSFFVDFVAFSSSDIGLCCPSRAGNSRTLIIAGSCALHSQVAQRRWSIWYRRSIPRSDGNPHARASNQTGVGKDGEKRIFSTNKSSYLRNESKDIHNFIKIGWDHTTLLLRQRRCRFYDPYA